MIEKRSTDLIFEGRISRNEANIGHLREGMDDLRDKIDELETKVDGLDTKMDAIIARIDAQSNQFLGASRLAKFLWFAFPAVSAAFGWFMRGELP